MFRSLFIFLSKAAWARHLVTSWKIGWRMAARFIAGEKIEDAMSVIKALNAKGINASLDHLGEHTTHAGAARKAASDILEALATIQEQGVRANVSIKLTQIGLNLDAGLCAENLEKILTRAQELEVFVRIDMEDSTVTQPTLDLLYQMWQKSYTCVGIVIQSYLYRSEEDTRQAVQQGIPIRLCKGAYKEPARVAYPLKRDVDSAYDRLAEIMIRESQRLGAPQISKDGRFPPLVALATHDVKRIHFACQLASSLGLPKQALEFQMLNGIRRDLQEKLAGEGYPVRVYVPYGVEWYPYFMRRLAERPANVWFILTNFLRR